MASISLPRPFGLIFRLRAIRMRDVYWRFALVGANLHLFQLGGRRKFHQCKVGVQQFSGTFVGFQSASGILLLELFLHGIEFLHKCLPCLFGYYAFRNKQTVAVSPYPVSSLYILFDQVTTN